MSNERLSVQDVAFIYAERPTMPSHIGSLLVLGPSAAITSYDDVIRHVESRIHRLPRFRRKLHRPLFGLTRPVWVDDPDFSVRNHVRHMTIDEPQTDAVLREVFGRLQESVLERDKPLWELWVADFADGTRTLMQKTHHSLADGVSSVDILAALLDLTPDKQAKPPRKWTPEPPPSPLSQFRPRLSVPRLPTLPAPAELVHTMRSVVSAFAPALRPVPATSLTVKCSEARRYDFVRADLNDVKAIKNAHGVTVNDVCLTAVAGALGDLLRERGEATIDRTLRVLVPVNVRRAEEQGTLGNIVSFLLVDLPVGPMEPTERLVRIGAHTSERKRGGSSGAVSALIRLGDALPEPVLVRIVALVLHQQAANLVVTNVPGAQFPVYFMGAEVREALPYVPLGADAAIAVAVGSYNGHICFGLTGDRPTTPDLHIFAEGIEKALRALRPN